MKSTRRFAIVALLTIAVSLLIFMTEARHQIEEYQTHHRHRHHRHEIQQKLTNSISKNNYNSEMKSHDINDYENNDKESYNILDENYKIINDDNINNDDDYNNYNDDNDESNKEKYDIFDKNNVNNNYKKYNKHIKHKIINNDNHDDDDDDYDDQDEDDDDYDYDKNNDEYEIDDTEYSNSNQYYPKHKNLNIEKSKYILRDHRSRIDSRLYDAIIKDSIRDYKKLSPSLQLILLSHWHYYYPHLYHHYHHHHHHRHQQITNNYNNELNYLQKQHKKLHKKLPILSELESKINFKYNKNNDNQKIKNKKYNHNEEEINWNENNKDEIENDDENYNDDNDNDYDYDNNKNKNDNNDDDWIKKIEKELKSIKPEINNTTKLSVQSVKRDSRNIENKKFIKNNTHEILYNDNNNNNSDNKIINLNNKNTSIISINKDKRKSRNIINNNQLNQKINIENKKLNSTIQTFLPTTKSLDNKNINNDDNDEKYDTDDDDTDDTDDNNYTQTNMAYTVNDNEYETSVPVTTISPSTTMKIIENLNTTIIKQIKKSTFKKSNITRLQSSVNRASFNKFKTKDGKLSQTQQNGADYNDVILQNMKKLSREAICRWPRPRVIPVRNVYPNPSITYSPHCVILHKCSDDTGCCNNEQLTCAPIRSHPVEFYFYTDRIGQGRSVEKLIFYNDTDCECKNKYTFLIGNEQSHDNNNNQQQITLPPQNITQKKPCKCPSKYSPTIENDDCQCHCPKNNTVCNDLSIGKSYFSQDDKLCIQSEICALPYCAFGGYIKNQDRCPTKKDKFGSIANVSSKNFPKISTNLNSSKLKN